MRDLQEDLKTFENTVVAIVNGDMGEWVEVVLPEALERAIKAEAELQKAREDREKESIMVFNNTVDLLNRIKQAEADNAALRRVLLQWQEFGWLKPRDENFIRCNMGNTKKALETDSGAALLKELEELRRVRDAAKEFISKLQGCLDSKICNINECYICEHDNEPAIEVLKQALAEVEKEGD